MTRWYDRAAPDAQVALARRAKVALATRCLFVRVMDVDKVIARGPVAFAAAMAALGVQQCVYANFVPGPLMAPDWLPWRTLLAVASGAALAGGGAAIAAGKRVRPAATVVTIVLALIVIFFHLPTPAAILYDGIARTRALEALVMFATALMLAGGGPLTGRWLTGIPMAVFGVQHFMYARFVVTEIPRWIPGPLAWTYITGIAFIAAAAAIVVDRNARLAATWLGVMFGLWVIGLPYWAPVGLIAGLFNLIPLIGPFIGAIPALFIAFTTPEPASGLLHPRPGWPLAVAASVVLLVVQQIDNHVISPRVVTRTVRLHPLTVMLSLLAAGAVLGLWGMLLVIPVVAAAKILIIHYWDTRMVWPPRGASPSHTLRAVPILGGSRCR